MGERKVLNKYYPPDFDPALIPRGKRAKNDQHKVRMMVPFSVRCLTCGEYIGCGKKFNARKETVTGEEYLGIKIFRFYMKCTRCSSEITIKTDPQNSDYVCEIGAVRNYESTMIRETAEKENQKKARADEEEGNAMKALENRTMDNKMEMDILDGLDEIRTMNARMNNLDALNVLEQRAANQKKEKTDEEMEILALMQRPIEKMVTEDETSSLFSDAPRAPKAQTGEFKMPPAPKQKKSKIGVSKIGPRTSAPATNPFGLDY